MVAASATMTIVGPGRRARSPPRFFLGVYMTIAVGPGELLMKVTLPARGGAGDGYRLRSSRPTASSSLRPPP